MYLEWEQATGCLIDSAILEKLKNYQNIIIFGAGDSGDWTLEFLRQHDIFPRCYCDNSQQKWGKEKNGLFIRKFTDAVHEYEDAAICIASMWKEEIYRQICAYNPLLSEHIYDMLTSMAWETNQRLYESNEMDYIRKNMDAYENLHQALADEQSKMVLEGVLNYRLTRKQEWLKKIRSKENIYIDKVLLAKKQLKEIAGSIIIDGGAFDGDTVEMFSEMLGSRNNLNIHCYEADTANYEILENKITSDTYLPHNITLHKAALWDKKGMIQFGGNGLSGCVGKGLGNYIPTERIDDYPYEKVGLIKLDIEGAERNALLGAVDTIKKYKPVLAVCAYHLQDDLLVLSDFIQSLDSDYKLFLRHYMLSAGDTVLYGISQ